MWELQVRIDGEWQPVTIAVNRYTFPLRYNDRWDAETMARRLFSEVPGDVEIRIKRV